MKKKIRHIVMAVPILIIFIAIIMIFNPAGVLTKNSGWISTTKVTVWLLFFNPGEVLTQRSETFSMGQFTQIEVGQTIGEATEVLGEPIIIKNTESCPACKLFFYQGEYPQWAFGGTESWYVVDSNNIIIERVTVKEP